METEDRRVYLVNKLIDSGLTPDEDVELDALQMAKGRETVISTQAEMTLNGWPADGSKTWSPFLKLSEPFRSMEDS